MTSGFFALLSAALPTALLPGPAILSGLGIPSCRKVPRFRLSAVTGTIWGKPGSHLFPGARHQCVASGLSLSALRGRGFWGTQGPPPVRPWPGHPPGLLWAPDPGPLTCPVPHCPPTHFNRSAALSSTAMHHPCSFSGVRRCSLSLWPSTELRASSGDLALTCQTSAQVEPGAPLQAPGPLSPQEAGALPFSLSRIPAFHLLPTPPLGSPWIRPGWLEGNLEGTPWL